VSHDAPDAPYTILIGDPRLVRAQRGTQLLKHICPLPIMYLARPCKVIIIPLSPSCCPLCLGTFWYCCFGNSSTSVITFRCPPIPCLIPASRQPVQGDPCRGSPLGLTTGLCALCSISRSYALEQHQIWWNILFI
jgi:hypothetical protein